MILCFGETLLRFAPSLEGKWIEDSSMPTYIGGSELNVAFALARWKTKVKYLTALPNNYLTDEIITYLKGNQIDTSSIIKSTGRMGNYFLPMGDDFKNKGVIYDRNNSSFSLLNKEQINLDLLFQDVTWFHLSSICPALNENIAGLCLELVKEAKKRNITTSIDFNYRNKLWQYGIKPSKIMDPITQYCDVLMGNVWAVEALLDVQVDQQSIENADYFNASESCINVLREKYSGLKTIALTYRFDNVKEPYYLATFYHNKTLIVSDKFNIKSIIDKVGSGDCFMAGLIYGITNNWFPKDTINFCVKAAIKKLGEFGDHTNAEIEDIL